MSMVEKYSLENIIKLNKEVERNYEEEKYAIQQDRRRMERT